MPKPPQSRGRARKGRIAALAAAGVVAAAALTASAAPFARAAPITLNPLDGALGFNAFIEHDLTLSSLEAEGPIATGGDLTNDGVDNVSLHDTGTFVDGADARASALVVGGAIDFAGSESSGEIRVLNQAAAEENCPNGSGDAGGGCAGGGMLSPTGTSLRPLLSAVGALLTVGGGALLFAAIRRHEGS